jgi:membrane associated rhomboid family serine protease
MKKLFCIEPTGMFYLIVFLLPLLSGLFKWNDNIQIIAIIIGVLFSFVYMFLYYKVHKGE